MEEVRERTFELVSHLDEAQLTTVLAPIMSPLSWDLGHVAAYEDLWFNHRAAGRELLRDDLAALYDAFETPRDGAWGPRVPARGGAARVHGGGAPTERSEAPVGDGALHELVIRHELQHTETMLQAMTLAGIPAAVICPDPPRCPAPDWSWSRSPRARSRWAPGPSGFAYDNERPRHGEWTEPLQHRPRPGHQRHLAPLRRGRRL